MGMALFILLVILCFATIEFLIIFFFGRRKKLPQKERLLEKVGSIIITVTGVIIIAGFTDYSLIRVYLVVLFTVLFGYRFLLQFFFLKDNREYTVNFIYYIIALLVALNIEHFIELFT